MSATMEPPQPIWRANRGGQWAFLACPYWEMLGHGDRGGGKSASLIVSYLSHVGKGYGADWRGVIFRMTYPELDDLIAKSMAIIHQCYPGAEYNKSSHEWTFIDGEKLMFRHLENLKSYFRYHGAAFPFMGFDELTSWGTDEAYIAMLSCSRPTSTRPDMPLMVRATTNSYGAGHSWCKARFIQGKQPFVPYGETGRERVHIPILWSQNTAFVQADPAYHARLSDTIGNEAQRKAWLENSWDIIAGGRFGDTWRESVHVLEPFDIPASWRVDRSHDWGSSAPFATHWYAESNGEKIEDGRSWPRGTLFVIGEDYGCEGNPDDSGWKPNVGLKLGPQEIAGRTKACEENMRRWGLIKRQPVPGPADDNLFDTSRGRTMASEMAGPPHQIVWLRAAKGPGSRIAGWQLIEDRLRASLQKPMELPGLFVFSSCRHLIRTLPLAQRNPKNPEDIDMAEDHALDSLRYRCLAHGGGNVVRGVSL